VSTAVDAKSPSLRSGAPTKLPQAPTSACHFERLANSGEDYAVRGRRRRREPTNKLSPPTIEIEADGSGTIPLPRGHSNRPGASRIGTPPAKDHTVRKFDVKVGDQILRAQTEAEITVLFFRGLVTRDSPCRISGSPEWQDVNEFFPTLKYGRPTAVPPPPVSNIRIEPDPGIHLHRDERNQPALTSSLRAGWICFGLGLAIAWIFPPAFLFYSVALIMAVVAMCTHQVNKGITLLISTFVGMGTSVMISMFLALGLFAAAAGPGIAKMNKDLQRATQQQAQVLATRQRSFAALNQTITRSATTPLPVRQSTPVPIQSMSKRQLFDEIARIEKEKRDLRRFGRDIPLATEDYLEKLKTALDAGN